VNQTVQTMPIQSAQLHFRNITTHSVVKKSTKWVRLTWPCTSKLILQCIITVSIVHWTFVWTKWSWYSSCISPTTNTRICCNHICNRIHISKLTYPVVNEMTNTAYLLTTATTITSISATLCTCQTHIQPVVYPSQVGLLSKWVKGTSWFSVFLNLLTLDCVIRKVIESSICIYSTQPQKWLLLLLLLLHPFTTPV